MNGGPWKFLPHALCREGSWGGGEGDADQKSDLSRSPVLHVSNAGSIFCMNSYRQEKADDVWRVPYWPEDRPDLFSKKLVERLIHSMPDTVLAKDLWIGTSGH